MPDFIECKHCEGKPNNIYSHERKKKCSFCREFLCWECEDGVICPDDTTTRGLIKAIEKLIDQKFKMNQND